MNLWDLRGDDFLDEFVALFEVKRNQNPDDELRDNAGRLRYVRCDCGNRRRRGTKRCSVCDYANRRAA